MTCSQEFPITRSANMALCFYVLGAFLPSVPGCARHRDPLIKTSPHAGSQLRASSTLTEKEETRSSMWIEALPRTLKHKDESTSESYNHGAWRTSYLHICICMYCCSTFLVCLYGDFIVYVCSHGARWSEHLAELAFWSPCWDR